MEYAGKYMRINFILRHSSRMKKIFIGYAGMKKIFKKYDDPVNCVYILMSIDKKILPDFSGSIFVFYANGSPKKVPSYFSAKLSTITELE